MATKIPPRQLSRELRETHNDPDLTRRRWIVGLSLASIAAGKAVALFQMGMIKKLPDPPFDVFDSTRVDASDYGYKRLQSPDAFAMIVSSGITAWLAAAGGVNRAEQNPALPLLMAAKAWGDVMTTAELTREEWAENKALCFYCQVASACSVASAVLSLPEALRAVQAIKNVSSTDASTSASPVLSSNHEFASTPMTVPPSFSSEYFEYAEVPQSGTFIAEDRLEAMPTEIGATDSLTFNGISPTSGAPSDYEERVTVEDEGRTNAINDDVDIDTDEDAAIDLFNSGTRLPASNFATAR